MGLMPAATLRGRLERIVSCAALEQGERTIPLDQLLLEARFPPALALFVAVAADPSSD